MRKDYFIDIIILIPAILVISLSSCRKNESYNSAITDRDGNVYGSVNIGTQTWLNKDLRTTKFNNGELIPNIADSSGWRVLNSGAFCWYKNDPYLNQASYGALYNYYVIADNRLICPAGWHVPTINEWSTLINYLEGETVAGGRLKEKGTAHWAEPNKYATDEFGFSALPGGFRSTLGHDGYIGFAGNWWLSTEDGSLKAWSFYTGFNDGYAGTASSFKKNGFSIRCIKDL